jgi:hypothetical protein
MRKFFTFKISDEPYKTTTDLNKTVDAIYEGPKFLALCIHTPTSSIKYVAGGGETEAELALNNLVDEDPDTEFIVLDASINTFEAAYLTGYYTHDPIPDYTETLPTGETWTYTYSGGGITQNYFGQDLFYAAGEFSTPRFRTHAITKESIFSGIANSIEMINRSLADNDYTSAERQAIEEYRDWLSNLETNYPNIDHWKLPFPSNPPQIY